MVTNDIYKIMSTVLGDDVRAIDTHQTDNSVKENMLAYLAYDSTGCAYEDEVSVFELAYMCKDFCALHNHYIVSGLPRAFRRGKITAEVFNSPNDAGFLAMFDADTEPEAIFKATKYVIDLVIA